MPYKLPFIIAIDGPNASGKGTLARRLGTSLGFPILDTGLLYRAVGWLVMRDNGDLQDENTALHAADILHDVMDDVFMSNPELRLAEASTAASIVSVFPSVRQSLFDLQRNFALHPPGGASGVILDGRDIGTVICPDAQMKFFVTARAELRAERRAKELHGAEWQSHYGEMLAKTLERDKRDAERIVAPMIPAKDAIMLDTSQLDADQAQAMALATIKTRLEAFT